jgi:hypothetical protein
VPRRGTTSRAVHRDLQPSGAEQAAFTGRWRHLAERDRTPREGARILTMTENVLGTKQFWVVVVAFLGLVSSAVAMTLLWLLLTQPGRTSELVSRAF